MWYLGGAYGVLHGALGVFRGSCLGTSGLLEGYSDGASGILHARKRAKLEGRASALEGDSVGGTGTRCTAATGGIYSSAATDTCAFALVIGRSPICAAGVTWTSRTTSAQWAARYGHTSVIDAAGAIYVIGGFSGTYLQDVWVSTNGGADRTRGEELL